ncbi:MAG TPA: hypothetical protein VE177_07870, partial [Candidatus Binatus sp.]|nr:hypothetical protein [Candidatus Binatus sp.]
RIVINKILVLTPTDFQEKTVRVIEPYKETRYKSGLHTLSSAGEFTLIDGKRFRFYPTGLVSNFLRLGTRFRKRFSKPRITAGKS